MPQWRIGADHRNPQGKCFQHGSWQTFSIVRGNDQYRVVSVKIEQRIGLATNKQDWDAAAARRTVRHSAGNHCWRDPRPQKLEAMIIQLGSNSRKVKIPLERSKRPQKSSSQQAAGQVATTNYSPVFEKDGLQVAAGTPDPGIR